jgi:hypothetical protein
MRWVPTTHRVVVDIEPSGLQANTDSDEGIWRGYELMLRYRRCDLLDVLPAIGTSHFDCSLYRIGTLEMHGFIEDRKCRIMDVGTGNV